MWVYGTRQYKVGLRHEAVNDGLMARCSIMWVYGTRQYKVGLRYDAINDGLMARDSFCCRTDPVVMCHINIDIRITIAVCQ